VKYIIKPRDTLAKIAMQHGSSVSEILNANPDITNPNRIAVGEAIKIPRVTPQRPTVGGGTRPTLGRASPQVSGMFEPESGLYPFLGGLRGRDIDDALPTAQPPATDDELTKKAPWMETAFGEIGVTEFIGMHKANPRIMTYFKAAKFWAKDDTGNKNAWCGSFVAWVMQQNNIQPVAKAFRAREWKKFGKKINEPVYGAIGFKPRKKGSGHVAFIVGKSKKGDKYYMLGGNQDNKVQIKEYKSKVWETFVVPAEYDATQSELPVYKGKATKAGKEG